MPDDLESFMIIQKPTPDRPLLGLTVLIVEDSLFACEAMRLLCLRSGARIRRANNLKSARRHLAVYRPVVVIVDLGLPDGNGVDLIRDIANTTPRVGVLLGTSGTDEGSDQALKAGADGFLAKPIFNLSIFQSAILAHLPHAQQPTGLRKIGNEQVSIDKFALKEDLANVFELLSNTDNDPEKIAYVGQFIESLALAAGDDILAKSAIDLKKISVGSRDKNFDSTEIFRSIQNQLLLRQTELAEEIAD